MNEHRLQNFEPLPVHFTSQDDGILNEITTAHCSSMTALHVFLDFATLFVKGESFGQRVGRVTDVGYLWMSRLAILVGA